MFKIVNVLPIVFRSIRLCIETLSISSIMLPSSYIFWTICLMKRTMTLSQPIHKTTNISRRIRISISAMTMLQIILPLAVILSSSIEVVGPSAVHFIITPGASISITARKDHLALSLSQLSFELTLIDTGILVYFLSLIIRGNCSSSFDTWFVFLISCSCFTFGLWSIDWRLAKIFLHNFIVV